MVVLILGYALSNYTDGPAETQEWVKSVTKKIFGRLKFRGSHIHKTLWYEAMDFNSLSLTVDDEVEPLYLGQKCIWKKPIL